MKIFQKRIFFGHQSVGSNIINGIQALPVTSSLKFEESRTPAAAPGPCFFHAPIGRNKDPKSKIADFVSLINDGFGDNVDIACFKFCYIDIDRNSNVEELFDEYHKAMSLLVKKFQRTQFLHITTPIRSVEPGLRLFIKKLLGKKSIKLADNQKRQEFNELMLEHYANREPVFDIAKLESTYTNGNRCSNSLNNNLVYSLVPDYTNDGGHLNELGQQIVAKQFLNLIEQNN